LSRSAIAHPLDVMELQDCRDHAARSFAENANSVKSFYYARQTYDGGDGATGAGPCRLSWCGVRARPGEEDSAGCRPVQGRLSWGGMCTK
jgi:hypothetical protein